jgi:hypothetical protein
LRQDSPQLIAKNFRADPLLIFLHPAKESASDSLRFSSFAEAARARG